MTAPLCTACNLRPSCPPSELCEVCKLAYERKWREEKRRDEKRLKGQSPRP